MIQGHGDDFYLYKDYPIHCNFSSNVHYNIRHENLFNHLNLCWSDCCSYPEPREPIWKCIGVVFSMYSINTAQAPLENIRDDILLSTS